MEIDIMIARAKELIAKREEIDAQLAELFAGATLAKKTRRCRVCDGEGHTAATCPQRREPTTNS